MFSQYRSRSGIGLAVLVAGVTAVLALGQAPPPPPATVPNKALPPDLALIPANAVGFAHIRVADLWKHEGMKDLRGVFQKAGPKALTALDEMFHPAPSTIERITGVIFKGDPKEKPLLDGLYPAVIAYFNAPFDPAKVRSAHLPKAVARSIGGKEYYYDEKDAVAVAFVGNRILVLGDEDGVKAVIQAEGKSGVLAPAVEAATRKHVVAALHVKAIPIPPDALVEIPDEYRPLVKAELATLSLDIREKTTAEMRVSYPTAADATEAETALRKAAKLGRIMLNQQRKLAEAELYEPKPAGSVSLDKLPVAVAMVAALGAINTADEILDDPPIVRDRTDLTASVTLPAWMTQYIASSVVAVGALLPAVQRTREAAARAQSTNNLKQIGLALHSYHDTYGHFPPAAICDKKGKKLLSWRVAILPFLEQDNIYRQFKLDEPWDSEHNKKWSQVAIKTYVDPRVTAPSANMTHYKAIIGGGSMWDWVAGTKITQIADGTSNTIMVAAAGEPVPWAKPDDIEFDPSKELPDLVKAFNGRLMVGMADGSVRTIDLRAIKDSDRLIKLLITKAGGEIVPNDF